MADRNLTHDEKCELVYRVVIEEMALDTLSRPERTSFNAAYRTFLRGIFETQEHDEVAHEKEMDRQRRNLVILGIIGSGVFTTIGTLVGIIVGHVLK